MRHVLMSVDCTYYFVLNYLSGQEPIKTRPCEKCTHLERGTRVPDGSMSPREEVEMVWTCAKARKRRGHT